MNTTIESLQDGLVRRFSEVNVYRLNVPDVDVFIDAAGAPPLFDNVMKIVKPHARISVFAVYKNDVPVSLAQVMSKEVRTRGASGYTHEDFSKVVELLSNHASKKITSLITQVYKGRYPTGVREGDRSEGHAI